MDILGIGRAHRRSNDDTPVAILSRSFPVDTALSDLWAFLRDSLGQASLTAGDLMNIDATVADALTEVDDDTKTVIVSLRVFYHSVEVDILLADTPPEKSQTYITHGVRHVSRQYQRRTR